MTGTALWRSAQAGMGPRASDAEPRSPPRAADACRERCDRSGPAWLWGPATAPREGGWPPKGHTVPLDPGRRPRRVTSASSLRAGGPPGTGPAPVWMCGRAGTPRGPAAGASPRGADTRGSSPRHGAGFPAPAATCSGQGGVNVGRCVIPQRGLWEQVREAPPPRRPASATRDGRPRPGPLREVGRAPPAAQTWGVNRTSDSVA